MEDADLLYVRILEVLRETLAEDHPNRATALKNRAELL